MDRELTKLDEKLILEFLGFLSAEIEELHKVECPRLIEAWGKFKQLQREKNL